MGYLYLLLFYILEPFHNYIEENKKNPNASEMRNYDIHKFLSPAMVLFGNGGDIHLIDTPSLD